MKNISLANNPFVKIPSAKPSVSRNKKVICSQKSVVNNTADPVNPVAYRFLKSTMPVEFRAGFP